MNFNIFSFHKDNDINVSTLSFINSHIKDSFSVDENGNLFAISRFNLIGRLIAFIKDALSEWKNTKKVHELVVNALIDSTNIDHNKKFKIEKFYNTPNNIYLISNTLLEHKIINENDVDEIKNSIKNNKEKIENKINHLNEGIDQLKDNVKDKKSELIDKLITRMSAEEKYLYESFQKERLTLEEMKQKCVEHITEPIFEDIKDYVSQKTQSKEEETSNLKQAIEKKQTELEELKRKLPGGLIKNLTILRELSNYPILDYIDDEYRTHHKNFIDMLSESDDPQKISNSPNVIKFLDKHHLSIKILENKDIKDILIKEYELQKYLNELDKKKKEIKNLKEKPNNLKSKFNDFLEAAQREESAIIVKQYTTPIMDRLTSFTSTSKPKRYPFTSSEGIQYAYAYQYQHQLLRIIRDYQGDILNYLEDKDSFFKETLEGKTINNKLVITCLDKLKQKNATHLSEENRAATLKALQTLQNTYTNIALWIKLDNMIHINKENSMKYEKPEDFKYIQQKNDVIKKLKSEIVMLQYQTTFLTSLDSQEAKKE